MSQSKIIPWDDGTEDNITISIQDNKLLISSDTNPGVQRIKDIKLQTINEGVRASCILNILQEPYGAEVIITYDNTVITHSDN